ncbi:MAG: ABC transporter ATP-binding protein [Pseudomonadota bacterium]|nr:ABC transporter [Pseudomonadales bacterium]MDY6918730.1 ABC transporter ATP-binding protein [Pseudomonadota bacterium]
MDTALQVSDLRKTYSGGFEALKGISFEVQSGDFMALLGPNGAGKSTTISIICSLVNKTSGKVMVYGHDIDTDFAAAKMNIGIVPQEFNFNQFEKVADILRTQAGYYGLDAATARQRTEKYLKLLGLWDKRDETSRMLSGGMKRRLMIARALVHEPRLLILDEPTAGVDIELRRSMWSFLKQLNREGTTIILTTHYLEEAEQLCRTIAIIDHGQIIEQSSMKAFLAKLDRETFILDLSADVDAAPQLEGARTELIDPHTLEVELSKQDSLNAVFARLSELGITVTSMRNKANRLEELFVSLVEGKQA